MNPSEYNEMLIDDQANLLWDKGSYIEKRVRYGKYYIYMYSLFNFYVEVFCSIDDYSIKRINALETETDWHGYMQSINLNHLMR